MYCGLHLYFQKKDYFTRFFFFGFEGLSGLMNMYWRLNHSLSIYQNRFVRWNLVNWIFFVMTNLCKNNFRMYCDYESNSSQSSWKCDSASKFERYCATQTGQQEAQNFLMIISTTHIYVVSNCSNGSISCSIVLSLVAVFLYIRFYLILIIFLFYLLI